MKRYITILTGVAILSLYGCTKEEVERGKDSAGVPLELSGIVPFSDGINGDNIYLKAVRFDNPAVEYIAETLIEFTGGLSDVASDAVFPDGSPYYPLNSNAIRLFAYSGKATGDNMNLVAGIGDEFDAVLSNNGLRRDDAVTVGPYEGEGTPGSSDNPARLLQFRHVMTQLNVSIVVDQNDLPLPVDPAPENVIIEIDGIYEKGTYPITALEPVEGLETEATLASPSGDNFRIGLGTNYLIPNGAELSGVHFTRLIIDDYTATDEDLLDFTVTPVGTPGYTKLIPGYSYDLVITVQKLKVTEVTLTLREWRTSLLNDENATYEPYKLTLDLGNYDDSGDDDIIERVVLHTDDDKIYVGQAREGMDGIQYIILPPQGVNVVQADLYTPIGLLLSTPVTDQYVRGTGGNSGNALLTLPLSMGGMLTVNGGSVSAANPYMVSTPVQFLNVEKEPDTWYRQTKDIDLIEFFIETEGSLFDGFGEFHGEYDGNGFWLANLDIAGRGLFDTNYGVLRGIRIYSGNINAAGETYAGTICGTNNGVIVACFNEATISGSTAAAGGICGFNGTGGQILACLNTGDILEGETLGGICGANASVTTGAIAACINTGSLNKGADNQGGICGRQLTATSNDVFLTSFWLVGTAQEAIGEPETTIGTGSAGTELCSDLDPNKLRNEIDVTEPGGNRILDLLNNRIATYPAWDGVYHYILDFKETGITWPAPVKSN